MRFGIIALKIFLLLCIFLGCSAYNLVVDEDDVTFIVSPVVNVLGLENSSTSTAQLPSHVEPSYFGYSFDLYSNANGSFGLMTGSPKRVDPTNPAAQNPRITPWQDPKGSVESCKFSASLFSGRPASCQPAYPPNPKLGDSFGLVVPVRKDGATMACSPTRKQECGSVSYSPGTCYRSSDFGKSWNSNQGNETRKCPTTHVEVLFVLDGSGSVGKNFEIVRSWVKEISRRIGIDKGYVTVGVVQYSHYSADYDINHQPWIVTHIKIGEYPTYASFAAEVDKITLQGYTTYTGRALQKVMTDFKSTKNYNKPSTKQVMILLTDGMAHDEDLVPGNAEKLRNIGVIPFAIGVGTKKDVNRTELRLIANGDPKNSSRVFMVENFEGLDAIAKELEGEIGGLVLEGKLPIFWERAFHTFDDIVRKNPDLIE